MKGCFFMIKFDLRNKKFKKFSAFFLALGLSAGSCFLSNSKIHADDLHPQIGASIINNYDGSVTLKFEKTFDDQGKFMKALKASGNSTERITQFFKENFKVFVDYPSPSNLTYAVTSNVLGFAVAKDDTEDFSTSPLSALSVTELANNSGISVSMTVRDGVNITVTEKILDDGSKKLEYNFNPKNFYIAENDWSKGYYEISTKAIPFKSQSQAQ